MDRWTTRTRRDTIERAGLHGRCIGDAADEYSIAAL